jgi:hypothetical protein
MTEGELVAEITKLCGQLGLLWHHCRDSRHCHGQKGLPDLLIAGPHGVLFTEIKSAAGELTADQDMWIWMLAKQVSIEVWRPADLESGLIRSELEAIT